MTNTPRKKLQQTKKKLILRKKSRQLAVFEEEFGLGFAFVETANNVVCHQSERIQNKIVDGGFYAAATEGLDEVFNNFIV